MSLKITAEVSWGWCNHDVEHSSFQTQTAAIGKAQALTTVYDR